MGSSELRLTLFAFLVHWTNVSTKTNLSLSMSKKTYQPKSRKRSRRHGFLKRMNTKGGQAVITRRRRQGRKRLTTA